MKSTPSTASALRGYPRRRRRRAGGVPNTGSRPTPGWKPRRGGNETGLANPRVPSVTATLDIRLDEYFAAASLMGLLASMGDEPDQDWARDWSFEMGKKMAAESVRRRKRR